MEFEMEKSKVYVLLDGNYIVRCDGGYSISNVDTDTWTLIDEGYGDKYNLCQSHYFDGGVTDIDGAPLYILDSDTVREATDEERQAWREAHMPQEQENPLDEIQMALVELADIVAEMMGG